MRPGLQFALSRCRRSVLGAAALCCLALAAGRGAAQTSPVPATPADQQNGAQASPQTNSQTNSQTTPPMDQQQQPTPEAPTPQAQSTPGLVRVPKAVPSMMPHVPGVMVDRVVAIVNGQVVLDSDVDEEHRFEAIQPYPSTVGTEPSRAREIERLVDRALILQQARLETQETISDDDVNKEIGGLRTTLPACKSQDCTTDAGWARFLASHGFSVGEFQTRWKERMQVLGFIQERFGAGTSVTEGQVREFYQNTMLPQYRKAGAKPAPLASVEPRIREVLQQQQVSSLLRDWLQSLRAQGSINILHPGEEAP